jgi:hypothetical protein
MVNSGKCVEDLPFRIGKLPGSKKLVEMAGAAKSPGRRNLPRPSARKS